VTPPAPSLVLASGSPRRRQVMEQLGLRFDPVAAPEGTEAPWDGKEDPRAFARRLADAKARAVRMQRPESIIVAADTIVVLDNAVLEKPADPADAGRMLGRLAGRIHLVHTAVVVAPPEGEPARGIESTEVRFRALGTDEIERYVATGEPLDKAGAYGIQGYGAALVESVRGCYFNVMGFPVTRFLALLGEAGLRYEFPGRLVEAPPGRAGTGEGTAESRG
jgi:septum formation protein